MSKYVYDEAPGWNDNAPWHELDLYDLNRSIARDERVWNMSLYSYVGMSDQLTQKATQLNTPFTNYSRGPTAKIKCVSKVSVVPFGSAYANLWEFDDGSIQKTGPTTRQLAEFNSKNHVGDTVSLAHREEGRPILKIYDRAAA